MANTNTPTGFKLLKRGDDAPFNGSLAKYNIASGYATAIYLGDAVKLVSGKIQKAGVSDQIIGIAGGFQWVAANGSPQYSPYWPASTVTLAAADGTVLVYDDPKAMFEAAFTNSTSIPVQADVGKFFKHIDNGGSAATGLSGEGIDYTTATATSTSGVWKFMCFAPRSDNDTASAYSRGWFIPTLHGLNTNSGAT